MAKWIKKRKKEIQVPTVQQLKVGLSSLSPKKVMESSVTFSDTTFPANKRPSSSRTASFSSSSLESCSSLSFPDDSSLSPATPVRFSGVPFSWEKLPGIPKKASYKKKECAVGRVLPLPPPATASISKKYNFQEIGINRNFFPNGSIQKDPFFAALVECSKDNEEDNQELSSNNFWSGPKASRSISDRFGFINLYSSCKRACSVSDSIVYLPRSSSRTTYDLLLTRRSR